MKSGLAVREVESDGIDESASFGISFKNEAHLMMILRDTLYSDKILAILREYSANAWDAHRVVGKHDVPIKIVLPTLDNQILVIQDYGPGLSHEDMFQVYTQYGDSTKRDSNNTVGSLGLGSKSGFAYSDSFTVISCHGGFRRTYVALLDETDKGVLNLLATEPCGEETGITIQIPAKSSDIYKFNKTAEELFSYFKPRPDINLIIEEHDLGLKYQSGVIYPYTTLKKFTAVMGCIPYTVDIDQIQDPSLPNGGIPEYVRDLAGVLYFDIGDIHISASRESLKYTNKTKTALLNKINSLVDEFVADSLNTIENEEGSIWDKRLKAQTLIHLDLLIPEEYRELLKTKLTFKDPESFVLCVPGVAQSEKAYKELVSISINKDTKLIIKNEGKPIKGYQFKGNSNYLIKPRPGFTIKQVLEELPNFIKEHNITGIPVVELSSIPWVAPYTRSYSTHTNHFKSVFKLNVKNYYETPYASAWTPEDRVPTVNDVYTIIKSFRHYNGASFYADYLEDSKIAKAFNINMPEVYAYKTTGKNPVKVENCIGTEYYTWRADFVQFIVDSSPDVKKLLESYSWAKIRESDYRISASKSNKTIKELGPTHPISMLLRTRETISNKFNKQNDTIISAVKKLRSRDVKGWTDVALNEMTKLEKRYPLLRIYGLLNLYDRYVEEDNRQAWLDYIKVVDQVIPIDYSCFSRDDSNLDPISLEDSIEENKEEGEDETALHDDC